MCWIFNCWKNIEWFKLPGQPTTPYQKMVQISTVTPRNTNSEQVEESPSNVTYVEKKPCQSYWN
jgi:hypothetical protein